MIRTVSAALFIFLVVNSLLIHAQPIEVSYAQRISEESMRGCLEKLTSDSLGGRETGQAGQRLAAVFLKQKFMEYGLERISPDTFQYHTLSNRANNGHNLLAGDKNFTFGKDFFYLEGGEETDFTANQLLLIGGSGRNAIQKDQFKIAGKPVVLLQNIRDTVAIRNIAALHPSMVFLVTDDFHNVFDSLLRAERRGSPIIVALKEMPSRIVWISKELAAHLQKKIVQLSEKSGAPSRPRMVKTKLKVLFAADTRKFIGQNIPFLLRGSGVPEEVVVITAHYDHLGTESDTIFRGADDDASGTTAVVELARVFALASAEGNRPRRSILFMPVSGEEKGLLGSAYYTAHPLIPLENTVANINIDMIGRTDPQHDSIGVRDYVYVIGSDKLSTQLHEINESANKLLPDIELDYRFNVPGEPHRFYYRSDHYNFAKRGVPCIFYFNGTHADYHKHTDTPDKIQYDIMKKRTELAFLTLWELANRPDRIIVDRKDDMEK